MKSVSTEFYKETIKVNAQRNNKLPIKKSSINLLQLKEAPWVTLSSKSLFNSLVISTKLPLATLLSNVTTVKFNNHFNVIS